MYTALAAARSDTGCSTVLIPWVEEPVMVTPEVVGPVGLPWRSLLGGPGDRCFSIPDRLATCFATPDGIPGPGGSTDRFVRPGHRSDRTGSDLDRVGLRRPIPGSATRSAFIAACR